MKKVLQFPTTKVRKGAYLTCPECQGTKFNFKVPLNSYMAFLCTNCETEISLKSAVLGATEYRTEKEETL